MTTIIRKESSRSLQRNKMHLHVSIRSSLHPRNLANYIGRQNPAVNLKKNDAAFPEKFSEDGPDDGRSKRNCAIRLYTQETFNIVNG